MNNRANLTELYRSLLQRVGTYSDIQIDAVTRDKENEVIVYVDGKVLQQGDCVTLLQNNYLFSEIER